MRAPLVLCLLAACSSGNPDTDDTDTTSATDFGGEDVALDDACGGIDGLTGQALLDRRIDGYDATLAYVTADAQFVDPTGLTVAITWPGSPVATCFPPWDEAPLYAADQRVGIGGLTLDVTTDDGHFAESLDASAWLIASQGVVQQAVVVGATHYEQLHGDWVPFPEYGDGTGTTMDFDVVLPSVDSAPQQGSAAMGGIPLDRLEAGVFGSRFAVAMWPR
jgi:hypothetical protein